MSLRNHMPAREPDFILHHKNDEPPHAYWFAEMVVFIEKWGGIATSLVLTPEGMLTEASCLVNGDVQEAYERWKTQAVENAVAEVSDGSVGG